MNLLFKRTALPQKGVGPFGGRRWRFSLTNVVPEEGQPPFLGKAQEDTLERRREYLPFGRPDFTEEEIDAVARVLRSGWVGMGSEVLAFEEELATYTGASHVVAVSSCTTALHLTLAALGVGPGDEVICPSLTWCSTANAALYLGADVVFADVDSQSLCLSHETVAAKMTPRTKAVIVVHFGGLAIDTAPIRSAVPDATAIVEDAAHALGAKYPDGGAVGSSGDPTCFSFYANKNLSTADGGAVALADSSLVDRLQTLRQHGQAANAWQRFRDPKMVMWTPSTELGFKANYTDLQASIGRVQLRRFGQLQQRRQQIVDHYQNRLSDLTPPLGWQRSCFDAAHAHHLFSVLLPLEKLRATRNEILAQLRQRNIGATIHYAPLHQMPYYVGRLGETRLPVTQQIADRIMTLPISPSMTCEDADEVCDHLQEILEQAAR